MRYDIYGAVALFLMAMLSMVLYRLSGIYDKPANEQLSILIIAGVTLPLGWRRRWPLSVLIIVAVAFGLLAQLKVPEILISNIALFAAMYTVGAWSPDRQKAFLVRVIVIIFMIAWVVVNMFTAATDPDNIVKAGGEDATSSAFMTPYVAFSIINILINVLYFGGAYYFGNHAFSAARQRAKMRMTNEEIMAQNQVIAEQSVTIERLRIARELHDAVAHHVSVMGVQAGAARLTITSDPRGAAAALSSVEDSAHKAVEELHGLLGTLRDPQQPPGGSEENGDAAIVSLGVERIPSLISDTVGAGLTVTFSIIGDARPLPPLTSLNLYRITQEALTNARKHGSHDTSVDVRLRYLDDGVELEVSNTDTGAGAGKGAARIIHKRMARARAGTGFGIVGMRERVAADGGEIYVGPRDRGGFLVRVRIPLRDNASITVKERTV